MGCGPQQEHPFLAAQYHRLVGRLGGKRAAVAVAYSILVIVYHVLSQATDYQELGATYHDRRTRTSLIRRLTRRLEGLGLEVQLSDKEAA